jgi:succinyl-diaminopimelate desuccinylase
MGFKPTRTTAPVFVSDEEAGSNYGLRYIIKDHSELFGKE